MQKLEKSVNVMSSFIILIVFYTFVNLNEIDIKHEIQKYGLLLQFHII